MSGVQSILLSVLLAVAAASSVSAQTQPLTAEFRGVSATVRSGAPVPLDCILNYEGTGLLEGSLRLRVHDGYEELARVTIEDLVLSAGEQSFRTMLPAVVAGSASQLIEIRAEFVGKDVTIDLGYDPLRVPTVARRSFVNCFCTPWEDGPLPYHNQLINSLRIERFNPKPDDGLPVNTYTARLSPDEMPADPLYLCGFDVVLLADEGFSELREKQLRALVQWVDAGGSLCIIPSGRLPVAHVKILNELVRSAADKTLFTRDAAGRLLPLENRPSSGSWLARKGLGRVAVVENISAFKSVGFQTPDWRKTVAFLWKIRRDQPVAAEGQWINRTPEEWAEYGDRGYGGYNLQQLTLHRIGSVSGLMGELKPENLRVVPIGFLGLMLFLYVLAIGPADYFLLGFFRQRKLTWILFPVMTVGFTLFTVWMAHTYMAVDEHRKSVVFLDVAEGGRIVRKNRFELLFTGTPQTITTEVQRGIFTPLNYEQFGAYGYRYNRSELVRRPDYRGRIPLRYTATQHLPQWTPQLNRLLSIAPETMDVDFDWDLPISPDTPETRSRITERVGKAFGPNAHIYLYHGENREVLTTHRQLFQPIEGAMGMPYNSRPRLDFLKQTCVRPPLGLFSVVSQVSL